MTDEHIAEHADLLSSIAVLYVYDELTEHDKHIIDTLSKYIKNTMTAHGKDEAEKICADRDIDILITDCDMDGIDTLPAHVRNLHPSCFIIIYTSKNDPEHFMEAIELKVDKYMIKPCDEKTFLKTIIAQAESIFALQSLHTHAAGYETILSENSYDLLSNSIDELRNIVARISGHKEALNLVRSLKGVIDNIKTVIKDSV